MLTVEDSKSFRVKRWGGTFEDSLTQYRSYLLYYQSTGTLLSNRHQISHVYTISSAATKAITVELCRRKLVNALVVNLNESKKK